MFFFFNCSSITNWHVTVITARYLLKRVVFLSYLIFSAGRGTIEAVNVVITHSWKMGSRVRPRAGGRLSVHMLFQHVLKPRRWILDDRRWTIEDGVDAIFTDILTRVIIYHKLRETCYTNVN